MVVVVDVKFEGKISLGSIGITCTPCKLVRLSGVDVTASSFGSSDGRDPVGGLADELAASVAADRLKEELGRLLGQVFLDRFVYSSELLALVFLAAARANVNPARVIEMLDNYNDYHNIGDMVRVFDDVKESIAFNISSAVANVIELYKELYAVYDVLPGTERSSSRTNSLWRALKELYGLLIATSEEYNKYSVSVIRILVRNLKGRLSNYQYEVSKALIASSALDILHRAAEEARDPDVKRLAEIYIETIRKMYEVAEYFNGFIEDLYSTSLKIDDPDRYAEVRRRILERVKEAYNYALKVDEYINHLIKEAEEVNKRLMERSILLDIETEEEIKRRLLEA